MEHIEKQFNRVVDYVLTTSNMKGNIFERLRVEFFVLHNIILTLNPFGFFLTFYLVNDFPYIYIYIYIMNLSRQARLGYGPI